MSDLIVLQDVERTYRRGSLLVPVLRGISLRIARGSLTALMGASGSGKSTLLNILGCLDRPTAGRFWLDGQDVTDCSRDERARIRSAKIGFCFQSFQLLPRTSALENVLMPLAYSAERLSRRESRRRAHELLERVGLADRAEHAPAQLSGGEQQRVAIARALINRPRVLFADEPTGALDSRTAAEILRLFQELHAETGLTILLVTHDAEVAATAREIIRLRDGRIEDRAPQPAPPTPGEAAA